MTTPTRPKRRSPLPPSEQARIVTDWRGSGLSAAEYAKQHGLGAANLWRWNHKLRKQKRPGKMNSERASSPTRFVPLQVMSNARSNDASRRRRLPGSIEIELANGCVVRLRGEVAPETLKAALCAVQDVGWC